MKSIEDLKVEKTFYSREKDVFGNVTRTPYQKAVPRAPNVVTPGVRFGYYLIDFVFIYIIQILIGFLFGLIIASLDSPSFDSILMLNVISTIVSYLAFFVYYALFECYTAGSPGKIICGYTVIDKYAESISFPTSMLRSVCRLVPFEAFSCLGERGWHDKWSQTYVVKKSEKEELRKLLGKIDHNLGIID